MNPTDLLTNVLVFLVFFLPGTVAVALTGWLVAWIWMRIRRTLHPNVPTIPLDYRERN